MGTPLIASGFDYQSRVGFVVIYPASLLAVPCSTRVMRGDFVTQLSTQLPRWIDGIKVGSASLNLHLPT